MITLVCGGRNYDDTLFLQNFLDRLSPAVSIIVSGAQRKLSLGVGFVGADWLAIEWALSREIPFIGFPAQWKNFGGSAGPIRNALMLENPFVKINRVVAFPGDNGTRNMIKVAEYARVPVILAGW